MKTTRHSSRFLWFCSALISALVCGGCGESGPATLPVTGQVVYPDGTSPPLSGRVVFTSASGDAKYTAKGYFGSDGKFQLTTFQKNDGAVPGDYQVAVLPTVPDDRGSMSEQAYAAALQPINAKYLNPQTSGLRYTVPAENGPHHFRIEVTKPRGRR